MVQTPNDSQFIPFLMEMLSLIARWLNPELSERQIAILAGDFLLNVRLGPAGETMGEDDADDPT